MYIHTYRQHNHNESIQTRDAQIGFTVIGYFKGTQKYSRGKTNRKLMVKWHIKKEYYQ